MTRRQKAISLVVVLAVASLAAAVSLNVGWIVLNAGQATPLILGIVFSAIVVAGIILYTVFLLIEINRNEDHDTFISGVTHELKTPIASIRLYLETLQTRALTDEQRREFYGVMLADTDRLQQMVENVLKAGADRRTRPHAFTRVEMGALARECIDAATLRHHLPAGAVALDVQGDQPLNVMGDADDLRTAIANLLDNAVKYSGDAIRISVTLAAPTPDSVWVRVQDRGVGIPRSQLRRIFRRFYRVPGSSGRVKGTGLGLFLVRSIAKAHGGRVFAQSEGEGRGATFTVELPRALRA
ncbi:MAG: sensor histidine kinase [Vicinamibacterales bacterium]